MTRKKRMFDIDMPDEAIAAADTAAPAPDTQAEEERRRRGPMAAAIVENADALQARRAAVETIRNENDTLAHEYVARREAGQVVETVPLDDIHTRMLVRDRLPNDDAELAELITSIREIGLSNPIRVIPRPGGDGYELVQGLRRLAAYRALRDEAGQGDWAEIPALLLPGASDIAGLYRRMVDENVVRKDLSFAEMAHAAQAYAADPATGVTELADAVAALFQSAAYSKRSYIRSFAFLLDRLGKVLAYPTEVPRALGVTLARELKARPEIAQQISAELAGWEGRTIADELEVLRRYTSGAEGDTEEGAAPAPATARSPTPRAKTKTTFHMTSGSGQVKCTAAQGRLEIQAPRDFSAIDRARLEQAIESLLSGLG